MSLNSQQTETNQTGQIRKALSGFYYVQCGETLVTCRARGKFRKEGISPLVGDFVSFRGTGEQGYIEELLPRKNAFSRPSVANIDQLVVIGSAAIPITEPFLIDRIASVAALKNCEVIILLNKCDLDPANRLYEIYKSAGFTVLRVSAETGEGLDELKTLLQGKLSAFTGNSGVGKSSILNSLEPDFCIPVGEVSQALGRGKHTTRHVEIHSMRFGADVVDSPGFSSFDAEELSLELKNALPETFREFRPYLEDCRFIGCKHTGEKGCAVRQALKDGKIGETRYQSYLRLFEELKPLQEWQQKKNIGRDRR